MKFAESENGNNSDNRSGNGDAIIGYAVLKHVGESDSHNDKLVTNAVKLDEM